LCRIHSGEPLVTDEGYVGIDVHRAARICSAAHGGQIILSAATARLVDVDLRDLGEHRLKDLSAPQHLYQLGYADFPPLRTLNFTNLPVQATALVGRERECEEAGALLREHRLVTLVGPGGTGKTRLALQVAADATDDFKDGVFWVPLATTRDPELVESAIKQSVGVTDGLANHLAGKETLLLLDNFEQVVDAAPFLAEMLLSAAGVKLLVTSREPLRLTSEWEYLVPSLHQTEALALFAERARAVRADFKPDQAVTEICRQLDGLPLAIELAAARVKSLTPGQILERLGRRFDLLTAGARDVPARQQTLRATIDWSYELLLPEERELFARLGVFSGGWTLEAAEAFCDADLDTLQSLVAKSLVKHDGERFSMLETIREYSLERLEEAGVGLDLAASHARFFLAFAERAVPELEGSEQQTWTRRVSDEHDNIHAALEHFVRAGSSDLELRLAAAIWEFWFFRGLWQETRRVVERALASSSGLSTARVRALQAAAWIAGRQGDLQIAEALAEECLRLSRELGDPRLIGRSLRVSAAVGYWGPHPDSQRVWALTEEAVDLARSAGDLRGLAAAVNNAGTWLHGAGDHRGAADRFEESLEIARRRGDQNGIVTALLNISEPERFLAEYGRARTHLAECLTVARELGFREVVVEAVYSLACLSAAVGDYGWTAALLGAAQRQGDFGHVIELESTRKEYEQALAAARQHLGDDGFEKTFAAGREMTLDAVMDHLEKDVRPFTVPIDAATAFSLVDGLDAVHLSSFAVVGEYMRFEDGVRNALKDARQNILMGLGRPGHKRNTHLIWAAPGSGKTYFVEQVAASLNDTSYREINLARCDEEEFRAFLRELDDASAERRLRFIDECDAKPGQPWPYELLLPCLDASVSRGLPRVLVFAGSSGSNLDAMKQGMASRPKGADLLSRIPGGNVYSIEPMGIGDRVLVALSHLRAATRETGQDLSAVEKMVLFYISIEPSLGNARQLREFAVRAAERLLPGEDRVKYDHLFSPGNPENKAFWMQWQAHHRALVNRFVTVAD
jgi:predicted ATPase